MLLYNNIPKLKRKSIFLYSNNCIAMRQQNNFMTTVQATHVDQVAYATTG